MQGCEFAVVRIDLDGRWQYVSDGWSGIAGRQPSESLAEDWVRLAHPADRERVSDIWRAASTARQDFSLEYRIQQPDGEPRWVLAQLAVDRDAAGAVVGYVGALSGISAPLAPVQAPPASESPRGTARRQIEDELKLIKERYDFATAVGKVGTWDWNPATGELAWSDETFRLMGFEPGSIVPTYEVYLGLVHPEDRDHLNASVLAALNERRPYDLDCRVVLGNGTQLVCHVTGSVEYAADGRPTRMLGTIQDVTERKHIEDELKLTKERYDFATAVGKVGTWDWNPATGELAWSDETFRLMGFEPGSIAPTYEVYLGLVHPEDRDHLNASVLAALNERRPYDLDCRVVLGNGTQLVCHVTGSVEYAADGRPTRMLGTIQDVTERKHIEDELKLAKERQRAVLDSVLDSMVDGVLMLDRDGIVTRGNRAAMDLLEQPGRPLAGASFRDLFTTRDPRPILSTGATRDLELVFRGTDGAPLPLTANLSPQRTDDGDIHGFVVVLHDDRQLKQAHAQLQVTDRLATMGTLAAGVAHEINNPLAFVVSNLAFVAEELAHLQLQQPAPDEHIAELQRAIKASQDGAGRVRDIVLELKSLSRRDGGAVTDVSIDRLIDSAANMLRHDFRSRVRLVRELGRTPTVLGDEGKLLQVILNLLQNATQSFTGNRQDQPEVRVRTGVTESGAAFIEVQDNGSGIPREIQGRIFDAFFTTKPAGQGTGLGLSISHKIVTSFGGTLTFASEVGRGSTFRVVLPTTASGQIMR